MTAFRDYRPVIQTGAQCRDPQRYAARELDDAQLRERFGKIVNKTWGPTERATLRKTASSAML